eukprot:13046878-Heterocapsa_arctica.AAC.1
MEVGGGGGWDAGTQRNHGADEDGASPHPHAGDRHPDGKGMRHRQGHPREARAEDRHPHGRDETGVLGPF